LGSTAPSFRSKSLLPEAEIIIENNAAGCDEEVEVEQACDAISIREVPAKNNCVFYPNPTNGFTDFKFQVSDHGKTTLKIYAVDGLEMAVVLDEFKSAGEYSGRFDASFLTPGIYFYRFRVNDQTSTGKLILLR